MNQSDITPEKLSQLRKVLHESMTKDKEMRESVSELAQDVYSAIAEILKVYAVKNNHVVRVDLQVVAKGLFELEESSVYMSAMQVENRTPREEIAEFILAKPGVITEQEFWTLALREEI